MVITLKSGASPISAPPHAQPGSPSAQPQRHGTHRSWPHSPSCVDHSWLITSTFPGIHVVPFSSTEELSSKVPSWSSYWHLTKVASESRLWINEQHYCKRPRPHLASSEEKQHCNITNKHRSRWLERHLTMSKSSSWNSWEIRTVVAFLIFVRRTKVGFSKSRKCVWKFQLGMNFVYFQDSILAQCNRLHAL